ncbi:MAG: lysylphosphatidylglycerol synthase transmembrane domain-containing protein [Anaerolineales bacterium]
MTLALVLILFVLSKTDIQAILGLRERVSYSWVLAGFGLFFLMTVLKALQYHIFLRQDIRYIRMLNIVVIQNVVSNFVATGAGIASYFALSRMEQGVKISRSGVAFLLTKVGDVVAIWIFLLVSCVLVWDQIVPLQGFVVGLLLAMGFVILIVVLSILFRQAFAAGLRGWLVKLKLTSIKYVRLGLNVLDEVVTQEETFSLRLLGLATVYSLIYLLVTMLWFYANIRAFDVKIGVVAVVFVNVFVQLMSNLPIQAFGGLGVNESTSLYLYQFFFSGQEVLASALIGIRILFYLMNLATLLYLPVNKLLMESNKINLRSK